MHFTESVVFIMSRAKGDYQRYIIERAQGQGRFIMRWGREMSVYPLEMARRPYTSTAAAASPGIHYTVYIVNSNVLP